jgi:hypothetical protein
MFNNVFIDNLLAGQLLDEPFNPECSRDAAGAAEDDLVSRQRRSHSTDADIHKCRADKGNEDATATAGSGIDSANMPKDFLSALRFTIFDIDGLSCS